MVRLVRFALGLLILAILIGGPWAYLRYHRAHYRNLQVVRDRVLYRSGQLSLEGLRRLIHDHGIRTVISLRYAEDPRGQPPDQEEEEYCRGSGIHYVRIRPRNWSSEDGPAPATAALEEFFQVMDDPAHYPVLIHCFAGCHRTGAFCAVYRMEYEGWSNDQALAEMRHSGYHTLDDDQDVRAYLQSYRTRRQRQEIVESRCCPCCRDQGRE